MSLKAQVNGLIADPVLRWTGRQQAVLELRINATAFLRDKETNQWREQGEPLWVSANFWEDEAQHLHGLLKQGDRVTVEGVLVLESYRKRTGGEGISYLIRNPRFLGVIPKRTEAAVSEQPVTSPVPSDQDAPF